MIRYLLTIVGNASSYQNADEVYEDLVDNANELYREIRS